ncbi:MAG: phage regulatory protein [Chlamydiales bacterium]|jgi:transcriptional regulator with XRE-family HTH domain|nr:phage regulatory protein [Chlamydiales bacterium]
MAEDVGKKNAFGQRLVALRKEAGLTQGELAKEIGTTRRVIDYYERESMQPPAQLLVGLSRALGRSIEELLGVRAKGRQIKKGAKLDGRLEKRLGAIEKLSPKAKKQLIDLIDLFLAAEQVKSS